MPDARVADVLVRRSPGDDELDPVELELLPRPAGTLEVSDVRRVEGAAEDPDPTHSAGSSPTGTGQGRTWPSPSMRYLEVHSSRIPIGPRACSFWVELPISAPIPNSPPSVNRVEALT